MSVNVDNGSLHFESTLDNSQFQAAGLQDVKLIETILKLTGDTSGIQRYEDAVKESLTIEANLRAELAKILTDAQAKTETFKETLIPPSTGTIFSNSVTEVEAYTASLQALGDTGNVALSGADQLLTELNADLAAGTISAEEYKIAIDAMTEAQARFARENGVATTTIEEEIGVLEELKITLVQLKAAQAGANSTNLPIINKQIQETEANIVQFNNIGKVGFDEFGNKLEQATVKSGKFASAIDRVTNLQNIGSRVVTQFTRQIVSLGVGFLSLEIGAKAISSLIEYIQNLDIFTGRLDQATQNLAAFQAVQKEEIDAASKQIEPLRVLYDATQDLTKSLEDRVKAANELRDLYPAEFQNSTALAIVNGTVKKSYDDLTDSIIRNAKSAAAQTEIAKLAGDILFAQIQIQKVQNATSHIVQPAQQAIFDGGPKAPLQRTIDVANKTANDEIADFNRLISVRNTTIKLLEGFVTDVSKTSSDIDKANQLLGPNLENFDNLIANFTDRQQLVNIQKALQTRLNSLTVNDADFQKVKDDLQRVDDLLKQYTVKATTAKTDPAIALLASQTKVLQDIDALEAKYATKQKTRDQQQVDDLIATYTKEYNAAVAQNTKLAQFKKDHPNDISIAASQLAPIDLTALTASKNNALSALAGTQSVEETQANIEKQKKLFQQYEDFKLKVGEDDADKLFSFDLNGYKSYVDFLKSQVPTEEELNSADPFVKARASALQDFLNKELPKAQAEELAKNAAHLDELIIQYQNWEQKRNTLIATANQDIATLTAKGFTDQAQQIKDNLPDQLAQIEITGFEASAKFRKIFSDIDSLSSDSAKVVISNAQDTADALLLSGEITVEAYNKITEAINKAKAAINDRKADDLLSIGSALGEIGKSFEGINSGVAKYITGLGTTVTSLGNVSKAYDKFLADAGNADKQFQDGVGLAALGLTAIFNLVGSITSAAQARKKADEDYYNSVISFQNQYNVALDEQLRLQFQTNGNIFITKFSEQLTDAAKAYKDASAQYQQSLQDLQKGQAIVGQKNAVSGSAILSGAGNGAVAGAVVGSVVPVIGTVAGAIGGAIIGALGGLFGGKKKENVLTPLLAQYPQLIEANGKFNESLAKTLVANNQVSDATKTLLNNTISYYDEEQAAIDQINSSLQTLSDNLGTNLENALVTAFENGTDAAKAFGDTVSSVISNIVSQFLFEDIFGSQFDKLNATLKATVLAGGGSDAITSDFVDFFKNASPLVKEFQDGLKAAKDAGATQGLTLFPSGTTTSSSSTLTGGIQASITEDTATILAGTLNGIQLGVYNTNQSLGRMIMIAQDTLNAAIAIQINTKRTADNSDSLPDMLAQLKVISSNTLGSFNTELRAAGLN